MTLQIITLSRYAISIIDKKTINSYETHFITLKSFFRVIILRMVYMGHREISLVRRRTVGDIVDLFDPIHSFFIHYSFTAV